MAKRLLYEVSIIRPLVIFLMVVYHAFCIYGGQWETVNDVSIPIYNYLTRIISGFRIETITLVAGYVFAFQIIDIGKNYELKTFTKAKFKRLLIPCIIFSIVYYFLFYYERNSFSLFSFLLSITNGCGHLWFLPMLFWCFIAMCYISKRKFNEKILFLIFLLFSILPIPSLPFGLARVPHFLFYFYGGFLLFKYKDMVLKKILKWKNIILFFVAYAAILLMQELFNQSFNLINGGGKIDKIIYLLSNNIFKLLTTCSGIMALWLLVCSFVNRQNFSISPIVVRASSICYGVYIFHQFILRILYYETEFPTIVSAYWLPWLSCIITLIVSVFLTWLFLKTKIGKFLIG